MKSQILREYEDATFLVDLTAEGAPFQADPDSVQTVLGRLRLHYGIADTTLLSDEDSSVDNPRFPPDGFQKKGKSYVPLIHLLNSIVHATNDCLAPSSRHLGGLHFDHHGWEMEEIFDSHQPLTPDALGFLRPQTTHQPKVSWNDVAIIVEVGDQIPDLIRKLSTYACCYLATNRRRSFAPAIGFHHKSLEVLFFAFHRSGLSSSGPISLNTPEGFQTFVKYMVGILSIPDERAFGLDMTRLRDVFRINGRDYDIVRLICLHNGVRGRATVVYSLKLCTTLGKDNPVNLRSRTLMLADGVTALPDQIVYKLSYRTGGHTFEGPLFSKFLGQFGIIDVVGFQMCSPEEPFGSTEHLIRNGSSWNFAQGVSSIGTPEKRYLQCTAMSLECLPLLETSDKEVGIPAPAELLETILHAMIGHYNLFLGGVLHRDISQGNILRLQEPIERPGGHSMNVFNPVHGQALDNKCRGFLVDGDYSIEWRKAPPTPSLERSGTLPFMSARLLYSWLKNKPIVHTAVDDLESFLWVLIWALVHICLNEIGTTGESTVDLLVESFSSYSIRQIIIRESIIERDWEGVVFGGLFRDWLAISKTASFAIEQHVKTVSGSVHDVDLRQGASDRLEEYCTSIYREFIQTGHRHLTSIGQYSDWKAVAEANPAWLK